MSATATYAVIALCLLVLLLLYVATVWLVPPALEEEPDHDASDERPA
jgi:hypothetical protein